MEKQIPEVFQEAKYDVFISYSRKDYVDEKTKQPIKDSPVARLIDFLDKYTVNYWIDKEGVYAGAQFAEKIATAIRESRMMVFVSSKASNNDSRWTAGEIMEAFDVGKRIIPFRIDDTPFSTKFSIILRPLEYIDYFSAPEASLERLLRSIEGGEDLNATASGRIGAGSKIGIFSGHDYVDLGLPLGTLWATCNVGASKPSDYGVYFAWGETSSKRNYDWSNLKYCNNEKGNSFSKYNVYQAGRRDGKKVLELSDDAAHAQWGGAWRMPTREEWKELYDNCDWEWTKQDGCNGYKVTSKKNGSSIFLPAAGWRGGENRRYEGVSGDYWSSSLFSGRSYDAFGCFFGSGDVGPSSWGGRCYGFSVRPVASSLQ